MKNKGYKNFFFGGGGGGGGAKRCIMLNVEVAYHDVGIMVIFFVVSNV